MSVANAVALLVTLGSYLLYSRLLNAGEFGIYAGALALAKFGALALDAGLKTAMVQQGSKLEPAVVRGVHIASRLMALVGTALLALGLWIAQRNGLIEKPVAVFYGAFAAAYLATYPWMLVPLAQLEREMRFGVIARVESFTATVEYGLPALLWWWVAPGFWSFVVGAWLARILRAALLARSATTRRDGEVAENTVDWRGALRLLAGGAAFQAAVLASMVRDSLHLILVGPWFGREAAGLYAWALQLCGAASQVFVQAASRVALPWFRHHASADTQVKSTQDQVLWLTILTFPAVALLPMLAPALDRDLFGSKWAAAIDLLPYLVARMLPGLATTPLGTLLLARRGALPYARANWCWTAAEIAAAIALLAVVGPVGLAASYSVLAWLGLVFFVRSLDSQLTLRNMARLILLRPSVWLAFVFVALLTAWPGTWLTHIGSALLCYAAAFLLCVLSEPVVRAKLRGRRPFQHGT
jgi:O-antigen/teichoic acid export membrane protein